MVAAWREVDDKGGKLLERKGYLKCKGARIPGSHLH